jgi:hypothetical protein
MVRARGRGATDVSALPLAYFALAHVSLAAALVILAIDPALPGAFFYHARMIAVVHLLTIGWISGSILGAFYIVGPLALGMSMPVRARDWAGFAAFWTGALGMVSHFWLGAYDGMAWSASLVLAAIANIAPRGCHGICSSVPRFVRLHVRLAFTNILAAGLLGILIGVDKSRGFIGIPSIAATFAHAHLAAIGWSAMMIVGLSYRLMPMTLPASMPRGVLPMASAVLLETGLVLLVPSLIFQWPAVSAAGWIIAAGFVAFAMVMMRTALSRVPRALELPRRDWSVWQVHAAFIWLAIAVVLGLRAASAEQMDLRAAWMYGAAGLMGFIAQLIAGMHGRLMPLYAWYLASSGSEARPRRSAHSLIAPAMAALVFWCWTPGLIGLAVGLAEAQLLLIRVSSLLLLAGVSAGSGHAVSMLVRASRSAQTGSTGALSQRPGSAVPRHAH